MVKNNYELAAPSDPDSGDIATTGGTRAVGWRGQCLGCARWQWMVALLVATLLLLMAALVAWLVLYHLQYSTVYPASAHKLYMNASGVVEGDMLDADLSQLPRLWPRGRVLYSLDPAIGCPTSSRCEVVMSALDHLDNRTCLQLVAASHVSTDMSGNSSSADDSDKDEQESRSVLIRLSTDGDGCYSSVGYQSEPNSTQVINLDYGCFNMAIILHQLGHTLGLWNEHNRHDRDQHIQVNDTNVDPAYGFDNFDKYSAQSHNAKGGFDLESVMMYGPNAFSNGEGATIEPISGNLTELWERDSLSEKDVLRIDAIYRDECASREQV